MSYILDSLKKSDQERHSTQPNATEPLAALHDNYLTSTDKEAPFWSTWLIALVVLFFIVGLLLSDQYFFPINSVENDIGSLGGSDQTLSQNIEISPAIEDHRIEGAAQIAEVPPIVKASQAIVEDVQAGSVLRGRGEIEKPEMPLIKKENIAEVSSAVDTLYQQTGVEEKTSIDTLYENDGVAEVEAIKESIVVKSANQEQKKNSQETLSDGKALSAIPSIFSLDRHIQKSIPAIHYGAHIYASDNKSGFVILDGAKRRVGEKMNSGVYIEEINEDLLVLSFQGVVFSLPAMKSWLP